MRLADLEPKWIDRYEAASFYRERDIHQSISYGEGEAPFGETTIEHAQGVLFLCPRCFTKNGGPVGTHSVLAWFAGRGVPDDAKPGPGRWIATGTSLGDLTLSPSVDLTKDAAGNVVRPEEWHGFIRNGEVT